MTGLSVSQHNQFGSETMLTVTVDARKNLQKVKGADFVKWTGKTISVFHNLKSGNNQKVSLQVAVKINSNAGEIFELKPEHIIFVFVHEMAMNKLAEYRSYLPVILKELETKTPGINLITTEVLNMAVIKICVKYAWALDNYFRANFQTTVFDIDNLFIKYVESELKSPSSIPTTTSEKRLFQKEAPNPQERKQLLKYVESELKSTSKRPLQEEVPKPQEDEHHSSKRRKVSCSGNYFPVLISTSNNAPQYEIIPYEEPEEEPELTTLNLVETTNL